MSLNAMANAALARRPDYPPRDAQPRSFTQVARAARTNPTADVTVSTALQTLTTYFPAEVVTLYVAVTAALTPFTLGSGSTYTSHWITFWSFLAFTPVGVWVTFAAKLRADGKPLPLSVPSWPKWEMIAGALAYVAWAFGLPAAPFTMYSWYSAAIGGIAVLTTSTLLGMVAPLFQRQLHT